MHQKSAGENQFSELNINTQIVGHRKSAKLLGEKSGEMPGLVWLLVFGLVGSAIAEVEDSKLNVNDVSENELKEDEVTETVNRDGDIRYKVSPVHLYHQLHKYIYISVIIPCVQ